MIGLLYSLTFSFILVGPNGDPLSGEEALVVLERVDALNQLRARGYQVEEFIITTTTIPQTTQTKQIGEEISIISLIKLIGHRLT